MDPLKYLAYEVEKLKKAARDKGSTPQLGSSSIEDGKILEYDLEGTLKQRIGRQSDGTNTTVQFNGPTPPTPSTPIVEILQAAVRVSWDGTWSELAVAPLDLARIDVHITPEDDDDPLTFPAAATISPAGWGDASIPLEPGDYFAHLVAWTTSGQYAASAVSDAFTVGDVLVAPTEAPDDAPVLSIAPFAVGAVMPTWTAVDNASWYNVYASLSTGFDADDPANLQIEGVTSLQAVLAAIDGTQIPVDGTPVYVVVKAANELGEGPASNEVSATAREADEEFLSALYGWFGTVEAQTAILGSLNVVMNVDVDGVISIGDRITIADPAAPDGKGGIIIWGDDAHTVVLCRLHPDGNYLDGVLVAQEITVIQALRLIGDASAIASGARLKIENGVADPAAPSLSAGTILANWPAIPSGYAERGICWDDDNDQWWQLLWRTSNSRGYIRTIQPDGTPQVPAVALAVPNMGLGFSEVNVSTTSIVYANGLIFIGACVTDAGSPARGAAVYNTDGTLADPDNFNWNYTNDSATVVGSDGVDLYWGDLDAGSDLLEISKIVADDEIGYSSLDGTANIAQVDLGGETVFKSMHIGQFDLGVDLIQIVGGSGNVYHFLNEDFTGTPTLTPDTQYDFTIDANAFLGYKSTDGDEGFYSSKGDAKLARYSDYFPSAGEKWWAKYADTDGADHTAASPVSVDLAVPARRFVTVTLNPAPIGVTGSDVFVGYDTTTPATYYKRAETLTGRSLTLTDGKDTSGSTTVPSTNTLGGSPGELFDDFGNSWKGDGVIDLPGMRQPLYRRVSAANQSIATGGSGDTVILATLVYGSATEDQSFSYSSGVLTCIIPGTYMVVGIIGWAGNTTGIRQALLMLNGVEYERNTVPAGTSAISTQASALMRLEAGDTVHMVASQNSGGGLNANSGTTKLTLARVSA